MGSVFLPVTECQMGGGGGVGGTGCIQGEVYTITPHTTAITPPHGIVEVCGSDCGVSADNMLRNSTSEEVQITNQFLSSDLQNNRVCK